MKKILLSAALFAASLTSVNAQSVTTNGVWPEYIRVFDEGEISQDDADGNSNAKIVLHTESDPVDAIISSELTAKLIAGSRYGVGIYASRTDGARIPFFAKAWIDINKDGVFGNDNDYSHNIWGLLKNKKATAASSGSFNGGYTTGLGPWSTYFEVPAGLVDGTYKMRVLILKKDDINKWTDIKPAADMVNGSIVEFNIQLGEVTMSADLQKEVKASVSPVPFTTELNVVASEEATVSVVSVVGTQVYAGKAGVIDTQAWKSGVYFVVVAEGDAQKVIKVIK